MNEVKFWSMKITQVFFIDMYKNKNEKNYFDFHNGCIKI